MRPLLDNILNSQMWMDWSTEGFVYKGVYSFSIDLVNLEIKKYLEYESSIFLSGIRNWFCLFYPTESVVLIYATFDDNFGIKNDFEKYLKEYCCWDSE